MFCFFTLRKSPLLISLLYSFTSFASEVQSVRLSVPFAGIEKPLSITVTKNGEATVNNYPTKWNGRLSVEAFSSPLGLNFDSTLCAAVESKVRLARNNSTPPMMKERILESIRSESSVTIHASSVPFLSTQEFSKMILSAANASGLNLSAVTIVNPIDPNSFEVGLTLSPTALSQFIGDETGLRRQAREIFGAGTLLTGESVGEISALDLACDLKNGDASLTLNIKGTISSQNATRNLLDLESAKSIQARIRARVGEFSSGENALDTRRNAFTAGVVLSEEIKSSAALRISASDRIALFERLFSLTTGSPLALDEAQLVKSLVVPMPGSAPFLGSASLTIKETAP